MLSFLVFVWLSHSGVLPGSATAHGWGGSGFAVLAFVGWVLLMIMSEGPIRSHEMANKFCFIYGFLLVINAITYTLLRLDSLIGPAHTLR